MSKPKPPVTLDAAGIALWNAVVEKYTLRADELITLQFACRALDLADKFDRQWEALGQPLMSKGSMGQEVEHPLIGSADKQRKASDGFLKRLGLPDELDGGAKPNQQRSAAQSRWAQHGAGA